MKRIKNICFLRMACMLATIVLLLIPWYQLGIEFPTLLAGGKIIIDSKYFIAGTLVMLFFLLKIFEIHIDPNKKENAKLIFSLEEASEQFLITGLLIILAFNGFISVIIPIICLLKLILVDTMKKISVHNGKMIEKSKLGYCETVLLGLGIILLLFYNLPFELWNIYLADVLVMIGAALCMLNGMIYYFKAKNILFN